MKTRKRTKLIGARRVKATIWWREINKIVEEFGEEMYECYLEHEHFKILIEQKIL